MQTVRRLYLYTMSAITLATLSAGITMLLRVLLEQLGLGPSGELIGGDRSEAVRRELSVAIALVGVSTPVWLLHWWLVERSVSSARPNADGERTSTIRALYFSLVLGVLLLFGALAAADLIRGVLQRLLGQSGQIYDDPGSALAALLVTAAAWTFHATIRRRDMRVGPMANAAAWLPRAYLYVAAFAGLALLLTGVGSLIESTAAALVGDPEVFEPGGPDFRLAALAGAVAQTIVGAAIWLGHSSYAARLIRDAGWRGASERSARLRLAYYVAAIALGAIGVIVELSEALRAVLAAAFGAAPASAEASDLALAALVPAFTALPYLAAWWLHLGWARSEAREADDHRRLATVSRLDSYAVGLVGLAFGAVGLGWLLGLVLDVLLGGTRVVAGSDFWRLELSQFLPFAVIGSGVWLWKWRDVIVRQQADPEAEAVSTIRRVYLLGVLAASVLIGLGSLGLVVYRLVSGLLGVDPSASLVSELSTPLGSLVVAAAVALYNGLALRRDQALRAEAPPTPAPIVVAPETAGSRLRLVLTGPPESDLAATLDGMRSALPDGYRLETG